MSVPAKPRKRPEWTLIFLDALRDTLTVSKACQAAGVSRAAAYKYRDKAKWFSRAWDEAIQDGVDLVEQNAWELARKGDRTMLMFLLRSHRPTTYHLLPSKVLPPRPKPAIITFKRVPSRYPEEDDIPYGP